MIKRFTLIFSLILIQFNGLCQNSADIDNTFNLYANNFGPYFSSLIFQDGNKYLYSTSDYKVVRINEDGSIDNTFNLISSFSHRISAIGKQSNGKYIVAVTGSNSITYNGNTINSIVRFNNDGTLDNTFNVQFSLNNVVTILIQPDDKILYGKEGSENNLGRLLTNGISDSSFNSGVGVSHSSGNNNVDVSSIKMYSNDKIIIGGAYNTYNGINSGGITRINLDGSIDTTFDTGGVGFNFDWVIVNDIEVLNDGKMIVVGGFTSYNNSIANRIIKLNQNGTRDNSFNASVNNIIYDVAIQNDSKILIGGNFNSVTSGVTRNKVCRFNSDGSIDNTFDILTGFDNTVYTLKIVNSDKIIIGGNFTQYQNNNVNKIIRLKGNSVLSLLENEVAPIIKIYPNPVLNDIYVSNIESFEYEIFNILGKKVLTGFNDNKNSISVYSLDKGIYFLRLKIEGKVINQKFIKK